MAELFSILFFKIFYIFVAKGNTFMKAKIKSFVLKYLLICIGSVIYAVAISLFLDPNGIVPGGFTGIAIIIAKFFPDFKIGTVVLFLNIPIIGLGIYKFGIRFLTSTIVSVVLSSVMINLLLPFGPLTTDPLLACVAGGCLMAIGLELVLMQGATTGGTDIIVKLLRVRFRGISAGTLFILTDGLVVLCAVIVSKNVDSGLYATLCIIISAVVMDHILSGSNEAKMILIVSDKYREITESLMNDLDAGVTLLDGVGAYSGKEKKVVLCVIRKSRVSYALKVIKNTDDQSFAIITTANEVFGEGYKLHGGDSF